MPLFKILAFGCLLLDHYDGYVLQARPLATADKNVITDLAAKGEEILARHETVKTKRKQLDDEINTILEKERLASVEAVRLNSISAPTPDEKTRAAVATRQWQQAREEMKAKLKELEPRVAEVSAEEKALSADKAKLQAAAKAEADRLFREKKISKP